MSFGYPTCAEDPSEALGIHYVSVLELGPNLTEKSLQRAARSVSTLHSIICAAFDKQSGVPHGTVAHSTRSDTQDVIKVANTVLSNQLLTPCSE